jgi:hypothetical protein
VKPRVGFWAFVFEFGGPVKVFEGGTVERPEDLLSGFISIGSVMSIASRLLTV